MQGIFIHVPGTGKIVLEMSNTRTGGTSEWVFYGGVLQVGVDMDQAQYERDGDTITVTFPNWIGINDLSDVHYYKVSQKTLSQEKISNYY